jgi:hypothetical protein
MALAFAAGVGILLSTLAPSSASPAAQMAIGATSAAVAQSDSGLIEVGRGHGHWGHGGHGHWGHGHGHWGHGGHGHWGHGHWGHHHHHGGWWWAVPLIAAPLLYHDYYYHY